MTGNEPGSEETAGGDAIVVRRLRAGDLEAVARVDHRVTGRPRREYFRLKLGESLADTGVRISLAAEADGRFAGYLLARVYYGEFGLLEPAAVLDTIGVHPDFQRRGIGAAMLRQLLTDLAALNVTSLQTQVEWDDPGLLAFFQRQRFRPATRLCLEREVRVPIPGGREGRGA